jgi:hypothetical protein
MCSLFSTKTNKQKTNKNKAKQMTKTRIKEQTIEENVIAYVAFICLTNAICRFHLYICLANAMYRFHFYICLKKKKKKSHMCRFHLSYKCSLFLQHNCQIKELKNDRLAILLYKYQKPTRN